MCIYHAFLFAFVRSSRHGGPHDVYHGLSAHGQPGPGGLETTDMGLQLVIHVGDPKHLPGLFLLTHDIIHQVHYALLMTNAFTWCIYGILY